MSEKQVYCRRCHRAFAVDDMVMYDGKLVCKGCWGK